MSWAYYNEIDPKAAAWLRELIKADHIAPGEVDERSIEDVIPGDIRRFDQCHFFAGIGGWSYALRLAGWSDARAVWTGSCPCQPFSAAGKGSGFSDERHLWPAWFHLIEQCRPAVVFGEQVASKDGLNWLDLVSSDLEDSNYSFAAADLCAAGVGAPHIRQRLYFVGYTNDSRSGRDAGSLLRSQAQSSDIWSLVGCEPDSPQPSGAIGELADAGGQRFQRIGLQLQSGQSREGALKLGGTAKLAMPHTYTHTHTLADHDSTRLSDDIGRQGSTGQDGRSVATADVFNAWADAEWLACSDGKHRPVEPGAFPLAHGVPGRVGLLRGYGNAIVPQVAQAFIEAFTSIEDSHATY